MDSTPLVRAIVEALMFLEHATDDEIDPDVAVRGMEVISHELDALSKVDRAEFRLAWSGSRRRRATSGLGRCRSCCGVRSDHLAGSLGA